MDLIDATVFGAQEQGLDCPAVGVVCSTIEGSCMFCVLCVAYRCTCFRPVYLDKPSSSGLCTIFFLINEFGSSPANIEKKVLLLKDCYVQIVKY